MSENATRQALMRLLEAARVALGMDVAWLSRIEAGHQVLALVAGDAAPFGIAEGTALPLAASHAIHARAADLPAVVPDPTADGASKDLRIIDDLGIGAYAAVPVTLPEGDVYGMLWCARRGPDPSLGDRELRFLGALADAAEVLAADTEAASAAGRGRRVQRILDADHVDMALQPIVDVSTMVPVGAEALARFPGEDGPEAWFAEASAVGLRAPLELLAARCALARLADLDEHAYLAVNVSPAVACDHRFAQTVLAAPPQRVVVEITEHAPVGDYGALHEALAPLRRAGVRLAVDDAGSGFASFRHILALHPDIIKLDIAITRGVNADPVRRALAGALVQFAEGLGARIVAEGVETQGELDTLMRLGVDSVQGHFLARPQLGVPAAVTARPATRLLGDAVRDDALAAIATSIVGADTFEEFVQPILEAVAELTGLDTSYVTVLAGDQLRHPYVCNAPSAPGAVQVPAGLTIPWEDSLCARCQDAGILWTADVPGDLAPSQATSGATISTFMSVPVTASDGRVIGTLCAIGAEPRYLSDKVIAQVQLLAQLVANRAVRDDVPGWRTRDGRPS